jgi:hypothetical protein
VLNLGQVVTAMNNLLPRVIGTFTLANATTTNVTQPGFTANAMVSFTATNSAAALTERSNGLYISNSTAGVGFAVSTQSGAATGTETFQYVVIRTS